MFSGHNIWSDETNLLLFGSDGQKYIMRYIGKELHPDYILAIERT